MQLEFHQLDRRWEHLRVRHPARQRRLLASLAEVGQQTPVVVVEAEDQADRYVIIDGYKRIAALEQLGRDTVEVVVWPMKEAAAVLLDRSLRLTEIDMAVYRPSYRDKETGDLKESKIYWYNFTFAGRRIQESSKSPRKTVAQNAEKKRRQELETTFNDVTDRRQERIRSISDVATKFLDDYKLRNPKSVTFAGYAIGHLNRLVGSTKVADLGVQLSFLAMSLELQNLAVEERAIVKSPERRLQGNCIAS